jgi:hypothetical protein
MVPVKFPKLLLATLLLAMCTGRAQADAGSIGSELPFIEGPPDLVQSLRDSYAAGRPKAKKKPAKKIVGAAVKAAVKEKHGLAQVKQGAKESEKN